MKKILVFCLFFIFLFPYQVFSLSEFEKFKLQQQEEYSSYRKTVKGGFKKYKKELKEAFNNYQKQVSTVWGKKDAVMPDKKVWVQYRKDMKERNIVDFEKGKATIEVAISPEDAKDKDKLAKNIEQAIEKTVEAKPDKRSIVDIAKHPSKIKEDKSKPTLLANQVRDNKGKPVTKKNVKKFALNLLKKKKVKIKEVKGEDGKKRIVASISFDLVPNHLRVRAKKYEKRVLKESVKRKLPPKLVFAIMETESAFNPSAKSPIPAFGLMQLVPVSGGRDAYRFVHGKNEAPTDQYLYNPDNNVELGSAFLHILYYRYLKGVKNGVSRLWCTIASYNTGVGNLYNSFAGKYSRKRFKSRKVWKKKALAKINSMSSEGIYDHLIHQLTYEETRNYVKKVRKRMPKYTLK